ncbi:MAG: 4Fe-4S dicluster domain-containing protein [Nitrospirae bacterium]|nr:4Fe-4S dicluster domain-containing protein [Nitrospirota bacterium]
MVTDCRYIIFWGCTIQARFSFMEKATRLVFERLGIDYRDTAGFTCCPEKALVGSLSGDLWLFTAARNLAVAEREGDTLITPCNGCYSVLKTVKAELHKDPRLTSKVNEVLAEEGLSYSGRVAVKHLLEVLVDNVGISKIRKFIERPLTGLRIAAHPGCHLVRPSNELNFDDPMTPEKYDEIIFILGATPIHYKTKMLCCGGGLTNIGRPEETRDIIRTKLQELKGLNADAVTTSCPSCFSQLDIIQATMMREGENLGVPIITLSELLLLVMGYEEDELFFSSRRVSADSFLKKVSEGGFRKGDKVPLACLSIDTIKRCVACEACKDDCPVNINLGIDLHALMKRILEEPLDDVIVSPDIWRCLECHTCVELCPQVFGMEKAIKELKRMAIEKGYEPQLVKKTMDSYMKTGKIGEPSKAQRKKLGLPDAPESGVEGWKRLIKKLEVKSEK